MSRILYIDPNSTSGHSALNRVLIEKFRDLGFTVDLAMRAGYLEELAPPAGLKRLPLPERYFPHHPGKFSSRFFETRLLLYIRRNLIHREYDYIVFSAFDEIPLFFSGIRGPLILVVHGNVGAMDHPVKRAFMQWVAKRGSLLVFHDFIKQRCEHFGIRNVLVEAQGLTRPYPPANAATEAVLRTIDPRLVSGAFRHCVFAPSGSKYRDSFLAETIRDPAFRQFLAHRQIVLVIKHADLPDDFPNVVDLHKELTADQYEGLFTFSRGIILSYPKSFTYRVSAILHECFSNQKPCLLSDIEGFRIFQRHFRYDPFFNDKSQLITAIDTICSLDAETARSPYVHMEELEPTFAALQKVRANVSNSGGPHAL